jgi:hypothetical protein
MYSDLDEMMEDYLLTLDHTVDEDRHYDSEDYSEREEARAELERFVHWLHREKKAKIVYRLDPKPVKKNAWMMVYPDESRSRLFDTETDAKEWANHAPVETKVVKVTWEE